MKTFALRFLFGLIIATALSLSAWAQTKPGLIKAVKVEGEVFRLAQDGQSTKLTEGAILTESDTVVTGKASSVVLVFMNGASVKLAPETKLAVQEFKMDPLADDIEVSKLTKEPSVSKTKLNLSYGEVVGEVKHLNREGGSYYEINTPVGAAGIRGTTFRIVFRPSGDGKAFNFTLSTSEGVVAFTGTTQATGVDVPKDKEVVVTGELDPNTQQVTSMQVSDVTNISPSAVQAIGEAVAAAIQQAQQSTQFTSSEQRTPPSPGGGNPPPTNPIPPATNTQQQPNLTPQDGA